MGVDGSARSYPLTARRSTQQILLWNTRYLELALAELQARGRAVSHELARRIAPLGWEHISLTGDYVWTADSQPLHGRLRPLRRAPSLLAA